MNKKACVILGGTGQLGREVGAAFAADYEVLSCGRSSGGPDGRGLDLRVAGALRAWVNAARPEVVVLSAAYREPDFCEEHPGEARRLNVEPAKVLAECLPPEAVLVFVSSDYVFDGSNPPYREGDPVSPVNVYGQTKVEGEAAVLSRRTSIVVRPPVLFGAGPAGEPQGFVAEILKSLRSREPQVLDDVLMRRPTWTKDVAGAIRFLVGRRAWGIWHVSGPRGLTRYGWTVETGEALGLPVDHLRPSREIVPRRARRPVDSSLSTDKLRAAGYLQLSDFRDVAPSLAGVRTS